MRTAAVALLALSISVAAHAQCLHSFDAPRASGMPSGILGAADFDGDGKLDVATTTAVFLGFTKRVPLPSTGTFGAQRVTDVNRDGRPDIVGGTRNRLFALINNGDATFTVKTTPISSSLEFPLFYWADFNGDGLLDVFPTGVVEQFPQSTPFFLAAGDGMFTAEYGADFKSVGNLITADINGDRRADLLSVGGGFRVSIFLRQANGFAPAQLGPMVKGAPEVAADFNRDGRDDLIVVSSSGGFNSTIYFDLGGLPRSSASFPGIARSADFNADGAPDLIVRTTAADLSATGIRIYLNDGTGSFQATDTLPGYISTQGIFDADGDGIADLIANGIIVHGNGDGTFRVPRIAFPATDNAVAGDFDGDGDDDVALPNAIAWNNGGNTFRFAAVADPRLQRPLRAADVDGDGKAELVTLMPGFVIVLSLRPDGTILELAGIQASAVDVAVGDFSGKHRPELAMIIGFEVPRSVVVFEIRTGAAPRFTVPVDGQPQSIAAADLNGDGAYDIVVSGGKLRPPVIGGGPLPSGSVDGFLSALISTGTSFEAERRVPYPSAALHELVAGDFDGDGKTDAAATVMFAGGRVVAFFGDGAGAFPRTQQVSLVTEERKYTLRAVDLNGDGRPELAVNGAALILHGTPSGLVDHGRYFGPQTPAFPIQADYITYVPLVVRPRRGERPSIIVPTQFADQAFLYRPLCARPRAVRH